MRVNRILSPVTALGPGRRVAVWVQGCGIGCHGCASLDTWSADAGVEMSVPEVAERVLRRIRDGNLDGLTITGGEPLDQAPAVVELATAIAETAPACDVLLFTGYSETAARRRAPELFDLVDATVAGPYRADRARSGPLVASDNQVLGLHTERARLLYSDLAGPGRGPIQLAADDGDLVLVGMPDAGDLDRLRRLLADRGVDLEGTSWKP